MINVAQVFDSLKIQSVSIVFFFEKEEEEEERAAKKTQIFHFLKDRYFVMDGTIDMNVGVF